MLFVIFLINKYTETKIKHKSAICSVFSIIVKCCAEVEVYYQRDGMDGMGDRDSNTHHQVYLDQATDSVKMGLPHITSFCWCMGLEAGTKVIGYVHLLASLTLMVVCSVFAEGVRASVGTVEDAEDALYSTWYRIAVAVAVFTVVHVGLAATLLYAAYKRSTAALRTWLWVMAVLYVAALIYVLVSMTLGFTTSGSEIFLAFLEGILFFGILAYCILCVNSFYLMLKCSEDMEAPNKTDY